MEISGQELQESLELHWSKSTRMKLQEAAFGGEMNFIYLQLITMQQKDEGDRWPP